MDWGVALGVRGLLSGVTYIGFLSKFSYFPVYGVDNLCRVRILAFENELAMGFVDMPTGQGARVPSYTLICLINSFLILSFKKSFLNCGNSRVLGPNRQGVEPQSFGPVAVKYKVLSGL